MSETLVIMALLALTLIVVWRFPCTFGCHDWSMPGGWCEDCGKCDTFLSFFIDHSECGKTCRYWKTSDAKGGGE